MWRQKRSWSLLQELGVEKSWKGGEESSLSHGLMQGPSGKMFCLSCVRANAARSTPGFFPGRTSSPLGGRSKLTTLQAPWET